MSQPDPKTFHEDLSEEELSAIEQITDRTVFGDVRTFLLDHAKHNFDGKVWDKMSHAEQRDVINSCEWKARELVRRIVTIVAAAGRETVELELDSATIKDGLKVVLKGAATEANILMVNRGKNATFLLTSASAGPFSGERDPVEQAQPDQPDLLDGEGPVMEQTGVGKAVRQERHDPQTGEVSESDIERVNAKLKAKKAADEFPDPETMTPAQKKAAGKTAADMARKVLRDNKNKPPSEDPPAAAPQEAEDELAGL